MSVNNKQSIQKNNKTDKRKFFRIFLATFVIISFSGLGILAATFSSVVNTMKTMDQNNNNPNNNGTFQTIKDIFQKPKLDHPLSILVLGSDIGYTTRGRKDDTVPTRSDTMMLVRLDPEKNKVSVLSIPRDTRVLIPERRYYDKINAAYAYGGEKLARKTVANLTGVAIQNYLSLKVDGLINLVDLLGGVEVDIEKDMRYVDHTAKLDIDLKKGKHVLDGKMSHHYVRFRHDEIGDIGRVQRQQKFINAVIQKMLNPLMLLRIPALAEEAIKNINTDLPSEEIIKIAGFLATLKKEDIKMVMLPGRFGNIGGASYWLTEEYFTKEVVKELFPDSLFAVQSSPMPTNDMTVDPATQTPNDMPLSEKRKYRITVLNGSSFVGLGTKAARTLRDKGWVVWSVSDAKTPVTKTQIIVQSGLSKAVDPLQTSLAIPTEIVNASVGDISSDYTIIVGNDFGQYLESLKTVADVKTKKLSN